MRREGGAGDRRYDRDYQRFMEISGDVLERMDMTGWFHGESRLTFSVYSNILIY